MRLRDFERSVELAKSNTRPSPTVVVGDAPSSSLLEWASVSVSEPITTAEVAFSDTTFGFVPSRPGPHEVAGQLLLQTSVAGFGPKVSFALPAGIVDGGQTITMPPDGKTKVATISEDLIGVASGQTDADVSYIAVFSAVLVMSESLGGSFLVRLASSLQGVPVSIMPGSVMQYRAL